MPMVVARFHLNKVPPYPKINIHSLVRIPPRNNGSQSKIKRRKNVKFWMIYARVNRASSIENRALEEYKVNLENICPREGEGALKDKKVESNRGSEWNPWRWQRRRCPAFEHMLRFLLRKMWQIYETGHPAGALMQRSSHADWLKGTNGQRARRTT